MAGGALVGILAGRGTVRLLHRWGADPSVAIGPGVAAIRISLR